MVTYTLILAGLAERSRYDAEDGSIDTAAATDETGDNENNDKMVSKMEIRGGGLLAGVINQATAAAYLTRAPP